VAGGIAPPNFGLSELENFLQNLWVKSPQFGELRGKIEILNIYDLICQKFAAVCQKIAASSPSYFF